MNRQTNAGTKNKRRNSMLPETTPPMMPPTFTIDDAKVDGARVDDIRVDDA